MESLSFARESLEEGSDSRLRLAMAAAGLLGYACMVEDARAARELSNRQLRAAIDRLGIVILSKSDVERLKAKCEHLAYRTPAFTTNRSDLDAFVARNRILICILTAVLLSAGLIGTVLAVVLGFLSLGIAAAFLSCMGLWQTQQMSRMPQRALWKRQRLERFSGTTVPPLLIAQAIALKQWAPMTSFYIEHLGQDPFLIAQSYGGKEFFVAHWGD